jgi:hypothetical protein
MSFNSRNNWILLSSVNARSMASGLRVLAFVPIILGGAYLLFMLPSASAISVLQATSESISFQAQIPDLAQIRLVGFSLTFEAPSTGTNLGFKDSTLSSSARNKALCLDGLIAPEPGTNVTYKRFGTDPVSIVLERPDGKPAASFIGGSKEVPLALRSSSWIRLQGKSDDDDDGEKAKAPCGGSPITRLPIYGVAQLGSELKPVGTGEEPSSGVLLEATVNIFARALDIGPWRENVARLYPASVSDLALPPGSRVMEYAEKGTALQAWTGFARTNADEALGISVTTPAMKLAIVRPGVGLNPEILSIGLFTQLANDPLLATAQLLAAFIFVVFQALSAILTWFSGPRSSPVGEQLGTETQLEPPSPMIV